MPSSDLTPEKNKKGCDIVLTENTDDFIIGDRVWVNGTKPGYIQYLGDTRFGPGEWAGVVLDDHSGKNDGSVAGVRYFQCEPKRGVFSRLHKLTRFPITGTSSPTPGRTSSPIGSNGGRSGSSSPLLRCSTPTRAPSPGSTSRSPRLGDRVVVNTSSGVKAGVLRYLGTTDFAAGEWAGVELDEPTGKNDGTVAGKKYFDCGQKHGLFAPVYRVSKASGSVATQRKYHDDSHESLNSSRGSSEQTEVKAEGQVGDNQPPLKPSQKADFEQVQDQLAQLQREHRDYVEESEKRTNRLRQLLDATEAERKALRTQLQEEMRKVEDLQFRVDEERICKDDLETQTQNERHRVEELESKLQEETKKNEFLSKGQTLDSAVSEVIKKNREEVRRLKEQLREAHSQIQTLNNQIDKKQSVKASRSLEEELTRREENLLQMQVTLDNKKRELQSLHTRIAELEKEVESYKVRHQKHLDTIDDLNVKLRKLESLSIASNDELHLSKKNLEEAELRLVSAETKCQELEKEKAAMRDQMEEALIHDQISKSLNNQLRDKEKEISELERRLSKQTNYEHTLKEEQHKKIQALKTEHNDEMIKLRSKIEHLEQEVKKEKEKSSTLAKELARSKEEKNLVKPADLELVKQRLEETKEQLRKKQTESDRLRKEKEDEKHRLQLLEERCRRAEEERESHVAAMKKEVTRLRSEFTSHREDLVKKLAETQYDTNMAQEMQQQIESQRRMLEEVQRRLRESQEEKDKLHTELINSKTSQTEQKQELESQNSSLLQELVPLRKREKALQEEFEALQRNLEATQILVEQRQLQIDAYQSELTRLRAELSEQKEDRIKIPKQMENKIVELQVELARLQQKDPALDSENQQVKTEKEALENQIDFLHSVIVDMQKKNDDLRNRLDILETEVIFDGQLQLGNSSHRMACETCHTFDDHDTMNCPKQRRLTPASSVCDENEMF